MGDSTDHIAEQKSKSGLSWLFKVGTWMVTLLCFYLVFTRTETTAAREGLTVAEYLLRFFQDADWTAWLMVMIPYSLFFFSVDAHASWRAIRWFNAPQLRLVQVLPIRASAYILSLVNEQVGKGAMSLYLARRHGVPGWQALSTMVMLGLMEIYQLLFFSGIGVLIYYELVQEASSQIRLDLILPTVFAVALCYLPIHILFFQGVFGDVAKIRDAQIFRAFREARPIHYLLLLLFKAPNLLGAVMVYTFALQLFNVDVGFGQMLAFLPVIFLAAALPLPFHAGALLLWTVLFPEFPEVGVFSLIMHTFFVLFNAAIGVVFLPKANAELFDQANAK
ncbi:MAG: hypothetical protein CMP83_04030 [Gammaproteobacteria bacterium]|jgi:hypothetical protein|nr:hypothetical protein [Gammaproteobacteria bacterium]MBP73736.1 hypothetical protein [Gammaproteobacteria bacterium]